MDLAGKLILIAGLTGMIWLANAGAIVLRVDVTPLGRHWIEAASDAMAAMPAPGGEFAAP